MKPIVKSQANIQIKPTDNLREVADDVAIRTNAAIEAGINKPTASNGTPMENLNGAARTTATLKNIGREANVDGGMNDGLNTILLNTKATSIIQTLDLVQNEQTMQKSIENGHNGDE